MRCNMHKYLRDSEGKVLGIITDSQDNRSIRDSSGRHRAAYDLKTNITRDAKGRVIGTGDLLSTVIKGT